MLEVLHPQLHQFPPVRRFLVQNSTARTSSPLGWKTGTAEDIGAVSTGSLPADEAESLPTEITVHGRCLARLARFIGGATTHGAAGTAGLKIFLELENSLGWELHQKIKSDWSDILETITRSFNV